MTDEGWGLVKDPGSLPGPAIVRWYPAVQWFDGDGFADLLRSTSLYPGPAATSVIPCPARSPSASAPRWATGHHAAT